MEESEKKLEQFAEDLKRGKIKGFYMIACATVQVIQSIVSGNSWLSAADLLTEVKRCGRLMASVEPTESAIGNMVRRALKTVRDEYASGVRGGTGGTQWEGEEESLKRTLAADIDTLSANYEVVLPNLRESILDGLAELRSELETSKGNIINQAPQHIQSEEVVMTAGGSLTVEAFLKYAAKTRSFQVIVAEGAPFCEGQRLACNLASAGIRTTLIPDAAVFTVMSRVNKVVIGTHSVMANGGLKAACGTHALALAAKRYSVPLIVCCAMTKLSPLYLCDYDQDAFNKFACAEDVSDFASELRVQVYAPVYDYVPPDLVTLFISNTGGYAPSYVYRHLSEFYHPDDYDL